MQKSLFSFIALSLISSSVLAKPLECVKDINEQSMEFFYCSLQDSDITDINSYITTHPKINAITVVYDHALTSKGLLELANNPQITALTAIGVKMDGEATKALAENNHLIKLTLDEDKLTPQDVIAISQNTMLKSLWIGGDDSITKESILALASNTTLTDLFIYHGPVSLAGMTALSHNTTLQSLGFMNVAMDEKDATILAKNNTLAELHIIGIIGAPSTATSVAIALAQNHVLKKLYLEAYIGDEAVIALANNTTLTDLELPASAMSVKGISALAKNKTLKRLNLWGNNIDDEEAEILAHNTSLTELDVYINEIGSKGAIALAKNNTLKILDLGDNHIGDAGAIALAGNRTLESLDVSYNNIGSAGLAALADNKTIANINTYGNC